MVVSVVGEMAGAAEEMIREIRHLLAGCCRLCVRVDLRKGHYHWVVGDSGHGLFGGLVPR